MEFSKERVEELIKEFDSTDFLEAKSSQIRKNKRRIRKAIEMITLEMYKAKREKNEEYRQELYEMREKLYQLRLRMVNKRMILINSLRKAHLVIGILAIVILFGWVGYKLLSEGNYELSYSVKYATQDGYTNEEIFNVVDANSNWFGGTTDEGRDFAQVDLKVSLDLDENGINELNDLSIQWLIYDNKYELYAITLNGAVQNQLVRNILYTQVVNQGINTLNSREGNNAVVSTDKANASLKQVVQNKESEKQSEVINKSYKDISFDYFDYTLEDVEDKFSENYSVIETEGAYFIKFEDKTIPYVFGFITLEKQSKVETVYLINDVEFAGVRIGMNITDVIGVLGVPDSMGIDEIDETEYFTYYEFKDFSVSFISDSQYSPIKGAEVRKK